MLKCSIVFLLFFVKDVTMRQWCEADNQYPWSYNGPDNNPTHWAEFYPDCNTTYQTPIAINESEDINPSGTKFELIGFEKPITKAKVQNVGWTVMIIPEDDVDRSIYFDRRFYKLTQIRFHFGPENDPGAETVLDGVKYPLEIQYYGHLDESGFTTLSTLVDVDDDDNPDFNPIVDVLSAVTYRNSSTMLQSALNLSSLQPDVDEGFFFYFGRDSIPPCTGPYPWLLYDEVLKIGRDQLAQFNTLYSVGEEDASEDCLMGPNARPVQELGERWLWYYYRGKRWRP